MDTRSQKQVSAADRQTAYLEQTWREAQEAKAAGKKMPVSSVKKQPKWVREQQKKAAEDRAAKAAAATG